MERGRFEELVARAVNDLPEEFRERLENVDVVVEDLPSYEQTKHIRGGQRQILLGLYEGVPHTKRSSHYGLVPPDKITIFQKNIELMYNSDEKIKQEVGRVVRHEIAHHFGIGDARLRELERRDD